MRANQNQPRVGVGGTPEAGLPGAGEATGWAQNNFGGGESLFTLYSATHCCAAARGTWSGGLTLQCQAKKLREGAATVFYRRKRLESYRDVTMDIHGKTKILVDWWSE